VAAYAAPVKGSILPPARNLGQAPPAAVIAGSDAVAVDALIVKA
jgi:hypothetical protein